MKKIALISIWIGILLLAGAGVVSAETLYLQQTDYAGYWNFGNNALKQSLGNNLSGTLSSVTGKISTNGKTIIGFYAKLECFNDANYTSGCWPTASWNSNSVFSVTGDPVDVNFTFSATATPAFDNSKYYAINIFWPTATSTCYEGGWNCYKRGSNSDVNFTQGSCLNVGDNNWGCATAHDWYFKLYEKEIEENDIDFTAPIGGYAISNYLPHWIGDIDTATNTIWNFIDIEVSRHLTTATSSVISAYSFTKSLILEPNKENQPFDLVDVAVSDACYSYRARLGAQYGGLPPETPYLNYSDWFSSPEWIFCSGTASIYLPPAIPSAEQYTFETKDFGWLGNMFRDVLIWLFVPKASTLDNFKNLKDILVNKVPFGYFYLIKNTLGNLNATSTPAFVLASTGGKINDVVFQPLKTGLSWILWLFFAFWIIRRIGAFIF